MPEPISLSVRQKEAENLLVEAFRSAGWLVANQQRADHQYRPDLLARRKEISYLVELKMGAEGRSDRLIPLWSQAWLQAARVVGEHAPLAVVAAPKVAPSVAQSILDFAERNVPNAAAGVIDLEGLRMFRGLHLEGLNAPCPSRPLNRSSSSIKKVNLFSDLNQWMLKVLLAPELPRGLISAPHERYRNASELARAANVSVMSAFRLVQQLQAEGYLHEASDSLRLVRREDLFRRWRASALQSFQDVPMRFLLRGDDLRDGLRQMMYGGRACLALFAAAEELGYGLVQGVPPHIYVRRLPSSLQIWQNIVAAGEGEVPDLFLRRAHAPHSVFRGVVNPHGLASCDILQAWLDVAGHPARGREQAELIGKQVIEPLMLGN